MGDPVVVGAPVVVDAPVVVNAPVVEDASVVVVLVSSVVVVVVVVGVSSFKNSFIVQPLSNNNIKLDILVLLLPFTVTFSLYQD